MKTKVTVQVKNSFPEFMLIGEEWNRLLHKCESNEAYLTYEWFQSWWKCFGDKKEMLLLLFRKGDDLVGIVPLIKQNIKYRNFIKVRKISFWDNEVTPRVDIIAAKDNKFEVIDALIKHIYENQPDWDICSFGKIIAESETRNKMLQVLDNTKIAFFEKNSLRTPYILLHNNWENYFKDRPKKFRKAMRNNINRINKFGEICIEKHHEIDALERVLPEIFNVSQRSWKHDQNSSILDTQQGPFYEYLTKTAGAKGWIDIWILRHKGKAIAFEYHVIYENKSYALRGDFDKNFGSISPGLYLEYNIIKRYYDDGEIKIYDFCGDAHHYKLNWTNNIILHKNISIFNKNSRGILLKLIECKVIPLYKKLFRRY